jgi:hypothetical protein
MRPPGSWPALALIVLCGTGCAISPALEEQMDETTRAIRSAQRVGASEVPAASHYFYFAEEEARRAKLLVENPLGDRTAAMSWLIRAKSDAELAYALAVTGSSKP